MANISRTLESYSWQELSSMSAEIATAASLAAGFEIAQQYGLCITGGEIDAHTKTVKLTSKRKVRVALAGVLHDISSSSGKPVGLTFHFVDCIGKHRMNETCRNAGGWAESKMRAWLASEGLALLPSDLVDVVVPVAKQTNNVGKTNSISSVSNTNDKLWLFSSCELGGVRHWYSEDRYNRVLAREGAQYACFASDAGLLQKTLDGNPCNWWQRSAYPNGEGGFRHVGANGDIDCGDFSDYAHGVVPGSCV